MRKNAIKHVLFSLIGLAGSPAIAQLSNETGDLVLVEELPREIRVQVHRRVTEYLRVNPQLVDEVATVALDEKGTIYVLDKHLAAIGNAGQPSCMSGVGKVIQENSEREK